MAKCEPLAMLLVAGADMNIPNKAGELPKSLAPPGLLVVYDKFVQGVCSFRKFPIFLCVANQSQRESKLYVKPSQILLELVLLLEEKAPLLLLIL